MVLSSQSKACVLSSRLSYAEVGAASRAPPLREADETAASSSLPSEPSRSTVQPDVRAGPKEPGLPTNAQQVQEERAVSLLTLHEGLTFKNKDI